MPFHEEFDLLHEIETYEEIQNSNLFQAFVEDVGNEPAESDDEFDSSYNETQVEIDNSNFYH